MSLKTAAIRAIGLVTLGSCVILLSAGVGGPIDQNHVSGEFGSIGLDVVPAGGEILYELAQAAPADNTTAAAVAPDVSAEVMAAGEGLYTQYCVQCHRAAGEGDGGIAPRLAGNARLGDEVRLVRQVIQGGDYMPGFGPRLSDAEIAAIATYIRNSWANEFGPVTEEQVAAIR